MAQIQESRDEFIKLVDNIVPFMNGGLFECLDAPDPVLKGKRGGDIIIYEDGFSDRKDNSLCVPDYIFFSEKEQADLSEELGDKKQKDVTVTGLINILKSYLLLGVFHNPMVTLGRCMFIRKNLLIVQYVKGVSLESILI